MQELQVLPVWRGPLVLREPLVQPALLAQRAMQEGLAVRVMLGHRVLRV